MSVNAFSKMSVNAFSKWFFVSLCGVAVCAFALHSSAGDYEWVQPDEYTFGTCGNIGGSSVPGIINQKYFSQYSCKQTFDANKCFVQAKWYEQQLKDAKIGDCGAWLRQELSNCQAAIRSSARLCDQLSK